MTHVVQRNRLLAIDSRNTPLAVRERDTRRNACCPHGHQVSAKGDVRSGFNGEYREPRGVYILGSYRVYAPALRRFYSPDSASPFGRGGLNAYAYCLGDPVNRIDPTGHVPWWAGAVASLLAFGLAAPVSAMLVPASVGHVTLVAKLLGAVSSVMELATGVTAWRLRPGKTKEALGWISLVSGVVAGVAVGVAIRSRVPDALVGRWRAQSTPTPWWANWRGGNAVGRQAGGQVGRVNTVSFQSRSSVGSGAHASVMEENAQRVSQPALQAPPDYDTAISMSSSSPIHGERILEEVPPPPYQENMEWGPPPLYRAKLIRSASLPGQRRGN